LKGKENQMSDEILKKYRNSYKCECGTEWEDEWDSMCDDRCPDCDTSCSPIESEDLGFPFDKLTPGIVVQTYNLNKCVSQKFLAEDGATFETEEGEPLDNQENAEYQPFNMVVPANGSVVEMAEQIGKIEENLLERIKSLPRYNEECECEGGKTVYVYADWDFSSQWMLWKVCLKCGGELPIED
jgi:hypothetical protein